MLNNIINRLKVLFTGLPDSCKICHSVCYDSNYCDACITAGQIWAIEQAGKEYIDPCKFIWPNYEPLRRIHEEPSL